MEEYPDYNHTSAWLGGKGECWERGPYYMRGLVALAYVMNDSALIQKAKKWIEYPLTHQDAQGNFYPFFGQALVDPDEIEKRERCKLEWWAKMPVLYMLRDYYEAEKHRGNTDERVLPFLQRYFQYQLCALQKQPITEFWAKARGGDNVEIVLWLYDQVQEAWLLDLASLLLQQTQPWAELFAETPLRHHVVNTTQAMKTPHLAYKVTGDSKCKDALLHGIRSIAQDHGRIDDLPNADESARDNQFQRGTETCAVAEAILSMQAAARVEGDTQLYDLLESYGYNSLPNCFWYDMSRHCYFQQQNQVMLTHGTHGYSNDHGDSCTFGAPAGFDCCFANSHMAYPKFVQSMWAGVADGIAVTVYGANRVRTQYKGKQIAFHQQTRYPYGDTVNLCYDGETALFALYLRIPAWSRQTQVFFNGEPLTLATVDGYQRLEKTFCQGDCIDLHFHSEIQIIPWHHEAIAVKKGAVLYCLPIPEDVQELPDISAYREILFKPQVKTITAYPAGAWNYALYPSHMQFEEGKGEIQLTPAAPPCRIWAELQKDPAWVLQGNAAAMKGNTRLKYAPKQAQRKALIPYSNTRLKITLFPQVFHIEEAGETIPNFFVRMFESCAQVDFAVLAQATAMLLRVNQAFYLIPQNPYSDGDNRDFRKRDTFAFSRPDSAPLEMELYYLQNDQVFAHTKVLYEK
ncbi:MAG: glycoside hydrolase family 127 protein, partial [Clostridia bacterium]